MGGSLVSGMFIGFMINNLKFSTYVADETYCVSSCAAMWIAGSTKYASTSSSIGFHQPYYKDRKGKVQTDPKVVKAMRDYYQMVGVPKPAADFFVAADPHDVYWLNRELAAGLKIEIKMIDAKVDSRATVPGPAAAAKSK